MSARKRLPGVSGGDELTAMLRARRVEAVEDQDDADVLPRRSASGATDAMPSTPRTSRTRASGPMDRRSWYMPTSAAAALTAAVDDLHYETRRPKHEVLAALIDVALSDLDAVRARLTEDAE